MGQAHPAPHRRRWGNWFWPVGLLQLRWGHGHGPKAVIQPQLDLEQQQAIKIQPRWDCSQLLTAHIQPQWGRAWKFQETFHLVLVWIISSEPYFNQTRWRYLAAAWASGRRRRGRNCRWPAPWTRPLITLTARRFRSRQPILPPASLAGRQ